MSAGEIFMIISIGLCVASIIIAIFGKRFFEYFE